MGHKLSFLIAGAILQTSSSALAEYQYYGELGLGVEINGGSQGKKIGLVDVSSKLGFRGSSTLTPSTHLIFNFELGHNAREGRPDRLDARLSSVGLYSNGLELSIGKHESTFYTFVGAFMDRGQKLTGNGFQGSNRITNDIQLSKSMGYWHFQGDTIIDGKNNTSSTVDRWQLGIAYDDGTIKGGFAIDKCNKGNAFYINGFNKRQICQDQDASFIGAAIGWKGDYLNAFLGVSQLELEQSDSVSSHSITLGHTPNTFKSFVEYSYIDTGSKGITIGLSDQISYLASYFFEVSKIMPSASPNKEKVLFGLSYKF